MPPFHPQWKVAREDPGFDPACPFGVLCHPFAPGWPVSRRLAQGWLCGPPAVSGAPCRHGTAPPTRASYASLKLLKMACCSHPTSAPLGRQERVPAGAFAAPESHCHAGRDHGQVCQLSELRHAGVRCPLIPIARRLRRGLRRSVPVVRLDKPDRDTGFDTLRSALRHKTLGAVARRESRPGNRVFDPNVFAHGSGVGPGGSAGMPARRGWKRSIGSCA